MSVVVATEEPSDMVRQVLTSLEEQTAARGDYEVVLVAGAIGHGMERWEDGVLRRLLVVPGAGAAGRLNAGVFAARHPLLLFLADDERAERELVIEHIRAHARHPRPEVAIVGRSAWIRQSSPLERWTVDIDDVPLAYPSNPRSSRPDCVHARTRNMSVKRAFLARRGVFDPSFERLHDVELAIRLRVHGFDLRSWSHARSARLARCELPAECEELRSQGPELARLAAADEAVRWLAAFDDAPARWTRAASRFGDDVKRTLALEAEVATGRGDAVELARCYRDVRWVSRARGLAEATACASAPAAAGPVLAVPPLARRSPTLPRRRVLVAGVVLGGRPNTAAATAAELAGSRDHDVDQRWVVVGEGGPDPALPDAHVAIRRPDLAPKFALLGEVLAATSLDAYDHVLLVDDDVDLPAGFVDAFLDIQRACGFLLAQPARAAGSPADHPITLQQPGALARRTLFVEQGPVVSIAGTALRAVVPFDLRSPMGWGYEAVWSHRLDGVPIGIVDATPVAHRLRPVADLYSKRDAEAQSAELLAAERHRPLDDCMRVLELYPLADRS